MTVLVKKNYLRQIIHFPLYKGNKYSFKRNAANSYFDQVSFKKYKLILIIYHIFVLRLSPSLSYTLFTVNKCEKYMFESIGNTKNCI